MAGTLGVQIVVDSATELVPSSGEGLPPEQKPRGRLYSVVAHNEWGKATVFDLEPEPEPEPPPIPREKSKTLRKSMLTMPKLSEVGMKEMATEEEKAIGSSDEDLGEAEEFWCLQFFQASLMATALEDTIMSLRILAELNNELRIIKTLTDMPLLLALKYDVKQLEKTDDLEGIDPENLGCIEYKMNKLEADRNNVINMFVKLYLELSTETSFLTILDYVTMVQDRAAYAIHIEQEEAKNKIIRRELAKQLRIQRNHHKTLAYDAEQLIASLKSQVEDAGLMTETKGRYVDNWQAARTEQHKQVIFESESIYTDSTFYYKRRSDHESRVHAEVESLTNIIINETLQSIEEWMDKYETDTEKLDLKIQIQKNEYLTMHDKRVEMDALYLKREKEMKAWNKFKEEREKERAYANRMTQSAITVQAWWRGLLVRKQLGPFRKRKGRKHK